MNTKDIHLLHKFESSFAERNWNELSSLLNPKLFRALESEELIAFPILAKVAQILTTEDSVIPTNIKIACLKCLGNSCFNSYKHKEYVSINIEQGIYCNKLYTILATDNENLKGTVCNLYPFDTHFPYEGVIEWTTNFISTCKISSDLSDDQLEILRLSIQFLCNLFTFAYKDRSPDAYNIPQYLCNPNLKSIIINLSHSNHVPLVRASCVFIHNALNEFEGKSFTELEKVQLCSQLLKPIKDGFESAKEALMLLLCQTNVLQNAYDAMVIENKLYLLELIYNQLLESVHKSNEEYVFTKETIEFLIERFCKRSDLILKTVDTYLDEMEPTEIVILLDILGTLTSGSSKEYSFLKGYKSLLINCTYLLKSIQMIGKQSNNYFTPLQKLSEVAPAAHEARSKELAANPNDIETKENRTQMNSKNTDLRSHPAFGFKAGLIRIIGNMSYKNKECQDADIHKFSTTLNVLQLREMDAVPLLLDCCNIDARNPLIMQWTILALRNLCEDNPANQEIVRNCTRVGVVECGVLQEMGLTLHEDEEGRKIGIVPLARDQK